MLHHDQRAYVFFRHQGDGIGQRIIGLRHIQSAALEEQDVAHFHSVYLQNQATIARCGALASNISHNTSAAAFLRDRISI